MVSASASSVTATGAADHARRLWLDEALSADNALNNRIRQAVPQKR
jgi:hypothetical protein